MFLEFLATPFAPTINGHRRSEHKPLYLMTRAFVDYVVGGKYVVPVSKHPHKRGQTFGSICSEMKDIHELVLVKYISE